MLYLNFALNERIVCLLLGPQLSGEEKSEVEIDIRTCSNRITSVRQGALRDRRLQIN